jgi:hypothetical protein
MRYLLLLSLLLVGCDTEGFTVHKVKVTNWPTQEEVPVAYFGLYLTYQGEYYNCIQESKRHTVEYPDCEDDDVPAFDQEHLTLCCVDRTRVELGLREDGVVTWRE